MSLEHIQDALMDALEEINNNVFSWQKEVEENLENLIKAIEHRSDFKMEVYEVLRKPEDKRCAMEDMGEAIKFLSILADITGGGKDEEIVRLNSKLIRIKELK
jgi:GTP cyclohydrolase FolE2